MYLSGMLKNTATGRFHPIHFRPAPLPGGPDSAAAKIHRHKSVGHHTEGFATEGEANEHVQELIDKGTVTKIDYKAEWDGQGVPASVIVL